MTLAVPKTHIDKAALFASLKYDPHAGQRLIHESRARFRVVSCGVRWGKSTAAAMEVVAFLLEPREKALGWCVAPTTELTRFTFDRARIAMHEHLKHRIVDDDTRSQRLVVRNLGGGLSEVRGKSTDSPTSLLGEALDFLVIDEASKVRDDVFESYLAPRLVDRKGSALIISTPRGAQGWFFQAWRRGQDGLDPEYQSWRAPSTDNPHVPPETIESERGRLQRAVFDQEYLAIFAGEELLPCEVCGCPDPLIVRDIAVIDLESEPRCTLCGEVVDEDGHTRIDRHGMRMWIDGGPALRHKVGSGEEFNRIVAEYRAMRSAARRSRV